MRYAWLFLITFTLAGFFPASAHRIGAPVVTFDWNENSDVWELTEKISAHDLEAFLHERNFPAAFLVSEDAQEWLGDFGLTHLSIQAESGNINYIGSEVHNGYVWIYYELSQLPSRLTLDCNLLMLEGQADMCLINVSRDQKTKSFLFQPQDPPRLVELP